MTTDITSNDQSLPERLRAAAAAPVFQSSVFAVLSELRQLVLDAADDIEEHDFSFDLRWKADMRAIKRWQAETGRELTWPDHTDLCVWLLDRMTGMQRGLEGLATAMEETPTYRETARTIRELLAATVIESTDNSPSAHETQPASNDRSTERYNYTGHDRGVVVLHDGKGNFSERPMTAGELAAREPAHRFAVRIYEEANHAAFAYIHLWELISAAIDAELLRTANPPSQVETSEQRRLTGYCDKCRHAWSVDCQPGTDVIVRAFHCPCGHTTVMD